MSGKIIQRANPNRHGEVRLIEDEGWFYLSVPGQRGCDAIELGEELAPARKAFDEEVGRMSAQPNWEAQARYDAEWGTDNGYAPWQLSREY
jgi:hypothetical protein